MCKKALTPMTDLRQRRKLQTTDAIRREAVRLVHDLGIDQVTVEMISEAAGISPRTFFNYFPFKEAALAPPDVLNALANKALFVEGKGAVLSDLADYLRPMLECIGDDRETIRLSYEISLSTPKLLALNNTMFLQFEELIADLMALRLQMDRTSIDVCHMAALIGATVRMGFAAWIATPNISLDVAVRQRLDRMQTLFGSQETILAAAS